MILRTENQGGLHETLTVEYLWLVMFLFSLNLYCFIVNVQMKNWYIKIMKQYVNQVHWVWSVCVCRFENIWGENELLNAPLHLEYKCEQEEQIIHLVNKSLFFPLSWKFIETISGRKIHPYIVYAILHLIAIFLQNLYS